MATKTKSNLEKEEAKSKSNDIFDGIDGMDEYSVQDGESADDILKRMQKQTEEKSMQRKQKKLDEMEAVSATKELLLSRTGKTIDIPIVMNDDQVMLFKAKRLSEAENSDILDRSLAVKSFEDMTAEELEESNDYNYRLLEKSIVEPKMSALDWKEVDTALVHTLVRKISEVLNSVDDTEVYKDLRKK